MQSLWDLYYQILIYWTVLRYGRIRNPLCLSLYHWLDAVLFRDVLSALLPMVSQYVPATAAFRNSRLKWNPFRYPVSCMNIRASLVNPSRALNDVRSLVGLFIVLQNKLSFLWIPLGNPPLHLFRILSLSSRIIPVCLLSQVCLSHSLVSISLDIK